MIASNASFAMNNFARKMPTSLPGSIMGEDPEQHKLGGRRRRASKLMDQLAISTLQEAANAMPLIQSTNTDSDESDESDESDTDSDKSKDEE